MKTIVGFDAETYLIQPGNPAPRMVCGQFSRVEVNDHGVVAEDHEVLLARDAVKRLRALIDDSSVDVIVGHNLAFDLAVACRYDPTLITPVFKAYEDGKFVDTMILEKLVLNALGLLAEDDEYSYKNSYTSLEALVRKYMGREIGEDKKNPNSPRLRFAEVDEVPIEKWPEEFIRYALQDSDLTVKVYLLQLAEHGKIPDALPQTRAAWWLYLAGVWGLRTNLPAVDALETKLRENIVAHDDFLKASGILRAKMVKGEVEYSKDTKKLQAILAGAFNRAGLEPPMTAGGKGKAPGLKTDRETLQNAPVEHSSACVEGQCAIGCEHQIVTSLVEKSKIDKLLDTYVPILREGTMRPICPSWNVLLATGRVSCRKPSFQVLPREGGVRECFEARKGYVYIQADYSFIELCTFAQVCFDWFGESALMDAINAGLDPHLDMAAELLGRDYDWCLANKGKPEVKQHRQLSKALNFGLPGGLGADSFVAYASANYGVEITPSRAKELKPIWLRKWPEANLYFRRIKEQAPFGSTFQARQVRSGRLRGGCTFTSGCNTYFQGLAADGAKNAGWLISKACYTDPKSPLYGSRLVVMAHDEFILESPEDKAPEAAIELSRLMVEGMSVFVPDVKVSAPPAMMKRWYKDAEAVYDGEGRLICWAPKGDKAA